MYGNRDIHTEEKKKQYNSFSGLQREISPSFDYKNQAKNGHRQPKKERAVDDDIMKRIYDAGRRKIMRIENDFVARNIRRYGVRSVSKNEDSGIPEENPQCLIPKGKTCFD